LIANCQQAQLSLALTSLVFAFVDIKHCFQPTIIFEELEHLDQISKATFATNSLAMHSVLDVCEKDLVVLDFQIQTIRLDNADY